MTDTKSDRAGNLELPLWVVIKTMRINQCFIQIQKELARLMKQVIASIG